MIKKTTAVRTKDIRNFADKYNSYYDIKNAIVRVAVFSISLLDPNLKQKEIKPERDLDDILRELLKKNMNNWQAAREIQQAIKSKYVEIKKAIIRNYDK